MKKKILFLTILLTLVFTSAAFAIDVKIDGENVSFTQGSGMPFIDSANRTQVPFRQTLEQFGASVSWNQDTQTAIAEKDDIKVEIPIGKSYIIKNGQQIQNDTVALIKDNRTYLPIRSVLEAFGASVTWDQTSNCVNITINNSTTDQKPVVTTTPIVTTKPEQYKVTYSSEMIRYELAVQEIEDKYKKAEQVFGDKIAAVKNENTSYYGSESEYKQELSELVKNVADLENELFIIKNDETAIKRRKELEEELAKAREDLTTLQAEHGAKVMIDALEMELQKIERQYEDDLSAEKTLHLNILQSMQ